MRGADLISEMKLSLHFMMDGLQVRAIGIRQ